MSAVCQSSPWPLNCMEYFNIIRRDWKREAQRTPTKNVKTFNIFRQQLRRKMLKLRKILILAFLTFFVVSGFHKTSFRKRGNCFIITQLSYFLPDPSCSLYLSLLCVSSWPWAWPWLCMVVGLTGTAVTSPTSPREVLDTGAAEYVSFIDWLINWLIDLLTWWRRSSSLCRSIWLIYKASCTCFLCAQGTFRKLQQIHTVLNFR